MSHQEIDAFIEQWGLDLGAYTVLSELSPDSCARVLAEFAPKAGTRDVNRLFHGFVKSVQIPAKEEAIALPKQEHYANGDPASEAFDQNYYVQAFVDQWALDESSQTALMGLDPYVQARVMEEFAPKHSTKDVNRLFHGFIKSVTGSIGAEFRGKHAADYWEVPSPLPPARYTGISNANTWSRVAHHEMYPSWDAYAAEYASWDPYAAGWPTPTPAKRAAGWGSAAPVPYGEVATFLQTWGLDDDCASALEQHGEDVKRRVLDELARSLGRAT